MKRIILIFAALLFAVNACGTTTAYVSYTVSPFNASPGFCVGVGDTIKDLKDVTVEGRKTGTTTWGILGRHNVKRGLSYTDSFSVAEQYWDFRVTAFDSTGNGSCPDSVVGVNYIRVPSKVGQLQAN